MRTRRSRERARVRALLDGLQALGDALRAGASLRQALMKAADVHGSPFCDLASALAGGRPLAEALHTAAASRAMSDGSSGDADVASAFCVLAVHAEAGGDPLPATRALADRLARRAAAREEATALTTQARLGARAILLLTPAFLFLVALSDPRGAISWFAQSTTRVSIVLGLVLQGSGALWLSAIVRGVVPNDSALARVPVLRAVRAVFAGRLRSSVDADVADCAGVVALALDAGLSPTAAVNVVSPYVRGEFGDALRRAVADIGGPLHEAVTRAVAALDGDAVERFARALSTGAELGVPLAPAMRVLATDLDERASLHLAEDVRRASIRVLVPLGVLVLPAFVLACLVPLFVGGLQGIAG